MRVKVSRDKFKSKLAEKGISLKKFGLSLQNDDYISYRTIQRNLADGTMRKSVLKICAESLGCMPEDLMEERS